MNLLVYGLTVLLDSCLELLLLSLCGEWIRGVESASASLHGVEIVLLFLLIHQLLLDRFVLFAGEREIVALPLPLKTTLAVILILVKLATRTNLLIYYSCRLKSVRQDNVRIHSRHIDVIDQRLDLVVGALVPDKFELRDNLLLNFVKVSYILFVYVKLNLECKVHNLFNLIN
jgi:hypothetical protein